MVCCYLISGSPGPAPQLESLDEEKAAMVGGAAGKGEVVVVARGAVEGETVVVVDLFSTARMTSLISVAFS